MSRETWASFLVSGLLIASAAVRHEFASVRSFPAEWVFHLDSAGLGSRWWLMLTTIIEGLVAAGLLIRVVRPQTAWVILCLSLWVSLRSAYLGFPWVLRMAPGGGIGTASSDPALSAMGTVLVATVCAWIVSRSGAQPEPASADAGVVSGVVPR